MKISTSKVKCYKACKKLYYFKYVEELQSVSEAQTLIDGKSYHSLIEEIYNNGGKFTVDMDNPKISAMAMAYLIHIYPHFKVIKAEEWFEYKLNKEHTLVGRFDAVAYGGCIVEHKTTSSDIDEEYIYGLQWDEQILNYMLASGKNEMYYTVCKKPTIRLRQGETNEQFYERCVEWYETDTDKKIRVIKVTRNQKEIEQQKDALLHLIDEIQWNEDCFDYEKKVDREQSQFIYYRNPSHCTYYGRRCEFASICIDYDPKLEYVEFKHKEYE